MCVHIAKIMSEIAVAVQNLKIVVHVAWNATRVQTIVNALTSVLCVAWKFVMLNVLE
jgi:uncharacterized membrane protein